MFFIKNTYPDRLTQIVDFDFPLRGDFNAQSRNVQIFDLTKLKIKTSVAVKLSSQTKACFKSIFDAKQKGIKILKNLRHFGSHCLKRSKERAK